MAPNKSELLINMRMKGQTKPVYAKYDTFEIGDEASKYTLKISGVSGDANDLTALSYHNNTKFSTYDQDNDNSGGDCSNNWEGTGWWFNNCLETLLTAIRSDGNAYWTIPDIATFVEMKFRRNV
uniref:Fibrinogen C-terminal domain-containing protein n=1 Tax=Clytia hemisphaerica TaxID=252671 RepID=A0A7M5WLV0_9CNID